MGFFGKLLGSGGAKEPPPKQLPPSAPRAPRRKRLKEILLDEAAYGKPLESSGAEAGPFPKRMRLRANLPDYNLVGSWQDVTLTSADDLATARAHVIAAYYKQFGIYRLPGGSETIRWNENSWREIRESLKVLYDPAFPG